MKIDARNLPKVYIVCMVDPIYHMQITVICR